MSYKSNFMSNFGGNLSNKDILTSVSNVITLDSSYSLYGRYFVLGNLLIQFSSIDAGFPVNLASGAAYTLNFPVAYQAQPYSIALTPTSPGTTYPPNVTLISFTQSGSSWNGFKFRVSDQPGSVTFIVIGPRPSNL